MIPQPQKSSGPKRFLGIRPVLLRLFRLGILLATFLLINLQSAWFETQRHPLVTLRQAASFFPGANRVQLRDAGRGLYIVSNAKGQSIGALLRTSPQTDRIIGYSGPSDVLIALDTRGQVAGLELLRSGDTPEHVEKVKRAPHFFRAFLGWNPGEAAPPKVEGVSGATLTSAAIAESLIQRLAGAAPSLRFPEALTLSQVQTVFTNAARFTPETARWLVWDSAGRPLGYALRTSPQADNISGYRGPTECLVGLNLDGRTIVGVRVLGSYDTESYVDQIRRAGSFLKSFAGRTTLEIAGAKSPFTKLDGVSGATQTARAVAEGIKRRLAADLKKNRHADAPWRPRPRDGALAAILAGAVGMSFTRLRGNRWARLIWQLVLVFYVGIVQHEFISVALLGGWAAHGLALKAAPGLVLLAAASLLVPWGTRRQIYCHQICPHGAAQQLLGNAGHWTRQWWRRGRPAGPRLRSRWSLRILPVLEFIPGILLAGALLSLLLGLGINLVSIEPFDAWSLKAAGLATITIAVIGLAASLFVAQPFCRFGCPTGALLRFVRTSGSGEGWGRRDSLALVIVLLAATAVLAARSWPRHEPEIQPLQFTGRTMGTIWSVRIRDEVADRAAIEKAISREFEWAESMTSHFRTNNDVAEFNSSSSTNWFPMPWPAVSLSRWAGEISRLTGGAYDITVGPLTRLWGFTPGQARSEPPSEAEIRAVQPSVGWQLLQTQDGQLRKLEPGLQVDFSIIAKGWAVDQVAQVLARRGYSNVLVEAGQARRASGGWKIGMEHPTRACLLTNESMATSTVSWSDSSRPGQRSLRLLDPRTARPVAHRTVSVSVRHEDCAHADAWASALNVLGMEAGLPLAERLGVAAQFVLERENGTFALRESSAWATRTRLTDGRVK